MATESINQCSQISEAVTFILGSPTSLGRLCVKVKCESHGQTLIPRRSEREPINPISDCESRWGALDYRCHKAFTAILLTGLNSSKKQKQAHILMYASLIYSSITQCIFFSFNLVAICCRFASLNSDLLLNLFVNNRGSVDQRIILKRVNSTSPEGKPYINCK